MDQDWRQRHGRPPNTEERLALRQDEIDQRILFAEALRLGLHLRDPVVLRRLYQDAEFLQIQAPREDLIQTALDLRLYQGDEIIRRRLIQRMRAIGRGQVPDPGDAVLLARYQQDPQRWLAPARLSFTQLYFRRAEAGAQRAQTRLEQLQLQGTGPDPLPGGGDPFLHGHVFRQQSPTELSAVFGSAFSAALAQASLQTGRWQGPFASSYGWHLLWLDAVQDAAPRPFAQVRQTLLREWRDEQEQRRLQAWIEKLRQRYRVRP